MDTPRSGFITALEHFWNGWGAGKENLMLIVCGSATSWISDKLLNNKGGLFDRTTDEIKLRPFTLGECERFYQANHIVMSKFDQVQCYMATGGIPYYISMLQKGKSLAQNIDRLFFEPNAKLKLEFDRLYSSLFTNAEDCKKIVRLLAKKQQGYTRKEIQVLTNLADGGGLSTTLKTLEVRTSSPRISNTTIRRERFTIVLPTSTANSISPSLMARRLPIPAFGRIIY